jgi:CRISPR-associated endonuclease/helicase Cas3
MSGAKEMPERPSPSDFGRFFKEVHGYGPFPWQEALVTRVLDRGWPALIDVPTGLGKTAVLDAAVFLNALQSEHSRRRVFLVVDRRIIVDQAHDEAERISQALENAPPGSVCERVRARLAVPGDDASSVLGVTRMRGGVNWSWLWIERPDRHAIVTGTVDQIGSRLLFRGYGVGERLRPIDAALVGTDSLIVIDEAHLSEPFFTTLRDVLAMDSGSIGRPPIVIAMSASPANGDRDVHRITHADVEHPAAGRRLRAPKSLHPVAVTATGTTARSAVADALAYWAMQLGGPGKVIGVVANTVHMARTVFEHLRARVSDPEKCVLLTGRIRPVDREYLLSSWYSRIRCGADRDPDAEVYVAATQTIEAGADIDLDGMVTQAASLSALVQRLGRLNRLGDRDSGRAVVVHTDKLTDPVYGPAA